MSVRLQLKQTSLCSSRVR